MFSFVQIILLLFYPGGRNPFSIDSSPLRSIWRQSKVSSEVIAQCQDSCKVGISYSWSSISSSQSIILFDHLLKTSSFCERMFKQIFKWMRFHSNIVVWKLTLPAFPAVQLLTEPFLTTSATGFIS